MPNTKVYTAQEMREKVKSIELIPMMGMELTSNEKLELSAMLRYAADVVERCEKVIERCSKAKDMSSPTWTFDSQAFAMDLYEIVNYILRGNAGNDNENK